MVPLGQQWLNGPAEAAVAIIGTVDDRQPQDEADGIRSPEVTVSIEAEDHNDGLSLPLDEPLSMTPPDSEKAAIGVETIQPSTNRIGTRRRQSQTAVFSGSRSKEEDKSSQCMIDVRRHASRLYVIIRQMVEGRLVESHGQASWKELIHHLFLAQSIDEIAADSSYFLVREAGPCSVWHAVDSVMDGRTENYMTASVRFGFIWTAFETFSKINARDDIPKHMKGQSAAGVRKMGSTFAMKKIAEKLDQSFRIDEVMIGSANDIRSATIVLKDIYGDLEAYLFNREETLIVHNFEYYRKLVNELRNHYVHGHETLEWPCGDDLLPGQQDAKTNALIQRHNAMSRIVLMLMQLSLVRLALCEATVKVASEIDEDTNEDDNVLLGLNKVLTNLHRFEYGADRVIAFPEQPDIYEIPEAFMNESGSFLTAAARG